MAGLKTFSELSLKKDKDLKNLMVPVKGPKGTSKYSRLKVAYHNGPGTADIKKAVNASVQSADRKPEKYTKPDGKVGIRMVRVDREIIKKEAVTPGYMAHMKKVNKNKEYAYPNRGKGKPISQETKDKMFGKKPKETKESIVDPNDLKGRPKKADPNPESPYGIKHPLHPANLKKNGLMKEESADEARWPDEMPPETDKDVDEALTMTQRMKKSRMMKRMKTRIKIGRDRAKRKMAPKDKLEKRANRQARNQIASKLTRGIPKRELSFARKQEIEKRLDKPALKQRIKRLARRLFKDVRKKEVQRKKG